MSTELLNPEHYLKETICRCSDSKIVFAIGREFLNGDEVCWYKPHFCNKGVPPREGDVVDVGRMKMKNLIFLLVCAIMDSDIPRSVLAKDDKGENINPDDLPDLIVLTAVKE